MTAVWSEKLVTINAEDLRIILRQDMWHSHIRPGLWDKDGQPCLECAARIRLQAAADRAGAS